MLCYDVFVSALQQSESAICLQITPRSWASLTPSLGHHRAPNWASSVYSRFPLAILYKNSNLPNSSHLSLLTPPRSRYLHTFVLYICVSIPVLPVGSSVLFF